MGGKAQRIDQMVPAPYYGWANASMSYPFYPYEFSTLAASTLLDTKFPQNTSQPNPYFDPLVPGSTQYLRNYPDDHPQKAHNVLDPLLICVRNEHSPRLQAGRLCYANMQAIGLPLDINENPMSVLKPIVMDVMDYHFYTGGWSTGRFPPLTAYGLYHSINAFPLGSNYVTGSPYQLTYPYLDELLYAGNYAQSYAEAVGSCKKAMGYMTELCVNIPLWSVASYWAWSTNLLGICNSQVEGPENKYTFMNAYKVDGSPILVGNINPPNQMNIVYSSWVYDYNNLDRMNLYGGTDIPPYNAAADQAGFVQDWITDTWDDGGETKTRLTMWFREDGYFAKPVSGDIGENVNASHYFWNAWLDYQVGDGWWSPQFRDLHHINIVDPYAVEIYFDTYGYWNTYYCQGPLRPMDTWMAQGPSFIASTVESFVDPTTPGSIGLAYGPVWIDYVEFNGLPLALFTDCNIVLGDLYIFSALGAGTLEVSYRYIPTAIAFRGYTPGSLPWQTIFEGAGMYYCTAFTEGLGGSATYKRNPFYYLETPPLGEIDFLWHWGEYDESRRIDLYRAPRTGCYQIDQFDYILAGSAFGSQGTGVPSSNWLPGADLSPDAGVIDVLDEVAVTGANWGKRWGCTEPPPAVRDVAVINIVTSKTGCLPKETVGAKIALNVNVTVDNKGDYTETFIV